MLVVFSAPAQARAPTPGDTVVAARSKPSDLVPLPRPRPVVREEANTAPTAPAGEAAPAASDQPAAPSACRLALTDAIAIAPSIPPVKGPGACGGDDLVRLEAVVLSDKRRVAVKPAAILRCRMAAAVADWVRVDVAPLAVGLGTTVSELDNFDSFECRGRNRVVGAKLSEHGRANALDVRGVKLADGRMLSLTDRNAPHDAREKARASVCGRFTTVLGPGSDGYHEDHIHLDLAERRNGYRICHWVVRDGATEIATPLPSPRPQDAPPRELASREDGNASVQAEDAKQVEDVKVQPAPPPPALSLSPVPLARQPADVAKPVTPKPIASKPGKSEAVRSDAVKPDEAKPATKPSRSAKQRAAREAATQPMQIVPDAKPANDPPSSAPHAKRRKTARAKTRRSEPDLPRVLRRMFE
ncbi:MAG: extensin family protein [Rhizobiales bacterium]|nr:extensin family protein [Hyphomicrobiales bacterium]